MHEQAMDGVRSMIAAAENHGMSLSADDMGLDVGGQLINGSASSLFPVGWHSLDLFDPKATYQADARTWEPPFEYDVVLCTEVLEHVRWWPLVVRTCFAALRPGGHLFLTAAAPPRGEHSAQGLDQKPADEFYGNVDPDDLRALVEQVFDPAVCEHAYRFPPGDVYLWSRKQ